MKKNGGVKTGRTIGESRERLETSSERMTARKKIKRKKVTRICVISVIFLAVIGLAAVSINYWLVPAITDVLSEEETENTNIVEETIVEPTVQVVDEAASGKLSSKMNKWIAEAESDFKELGYQPTKAVLPSSKVREVDFYLEGVTGYIKMNVDRGSAVSVEDADRMIRYLKDQGITEYSYIDVRVEGKGYWK